MHTCFSSSILNYRIQCVYKLLNYHFFAFCFFTPLPPAPRGSLRHPPYFSVSMRNINSLPLIHLLRLLSQCVWRRLSFSSSVSVSHTCPDDGTNDWLYMQYFAHLMRNTRILSNFNFIYFIVFETHIRLRANTPYVFVRSI